MGGASLWVALTVVASALLLGKQLAGHNLITVILVRVAALCFLAAGVIGADGWIGRVTSDLIGWVTHTGQDASKVAFGTALTVGVIVAAGSIAWLLALLPDSWWGGQMPDWGSVLGLFLPALAVSIPGPIGNWLRNDVFPALAGPMVSTVRSWFGM